ncbi:MAG TPA: RHS repeat-associated core domain-containing protein, partial [Nitrococcus sp.]|nr:RHS repeat-associated core domain-containing protein [Nitrococcus sp.]
YTTVGASSLIYDGNGNLTGDGTDSFSYDTENHLTSASALGNTIAYAYDPLGRRDSKTVNTTVTRFVWAGNQTIADYDGAGLDEPIVTITVNGASSTKAYNHQDGHGSVVALSDGATGAVTDIYAYGPYGESASLAGNAFRFTGRRLDAESGLYYYRARYYSPSLGRFLQTDPIGTTGGINLYAYVNDDPLNLTDPSGLLFKQMGRGAWHVISDPHAVLTGASFCPSVCGSAFSALDALVYYAQGDNTNGGIALAAAAIGVVGDAGAAKVAALGVKELAGAARGSGGEPIYRLGNSRESVTRLGRKSQQAEDALGIHGVSGSTTPPAAGTPCSAANCSALEAAGFRVHRTPSRRDPGHVTIELPKPVSKEAADAFNEVFGR